jgi:cell wall assembly regulator SMI1
MEPINLRHYTVWTNRENGTFQVQCDVEGCEFTSLTRKSLDGNVPRDVRKAYMLHWHQAHRDLAAL